jgi:hypothetical protein
MKWNLCFIAVLFGLLSPCCVSQPVIQDRPAVSGKRLDQKGRTGLLVFSGYYGFWLGVVPHLLWENTLIESKGKNLALGPLITTPAALITTYYLTKNRPITRTQTSLITMGGHWGTWQGLGWTAAAGMEKEAIVATGAVAGLVCIGGGVLAGQTDLFSEGGAALVHSSMFMGAWFGYVTAELLDLDEKDLLTNMLLASDVFMLSSGILFSKTSFKRNKVIRLNGTIYGGALIAWCTYLIYSVENEKDDYDHDTAVAIAGAGSLLGIIGSTIDLSMFSEKNSPARFGEKLIIGPSFTWYTDSVHERKLLPGAEIRMIF